MATQHGAVADAARGDKIIAILASGFSVIVLSISAAARLSARPLGRIMNALPICVIVYRLPNMQRIAKLCL
jgi:hypothetical protein